MPAIPAVYAPNDRKQNELGDKERKERLDLINTYWAYYKGEQRRPLRVEPGAVDDNIILNLSGQIMDKKVSFFAPEPPLFNVQMVTEYEPAADGLTKQEPPEQSAVDAFWEANDLETFVTDLALSGFIAGHAFVRLYPPENIQPMSAENPPRVVALDPRLVSVYWDESNIYRTLFYRLTWESGGGGLRRQDIVPVWLLNGETRPPVDGSTNGLQWVIIEYKSKTGFKWEETARDMWGYPFPPIIDWKNLPAPHEFYGRSDLRDADMNDAINFVASNTVRIIRFHAHPRTIAKNFDTSSIKGTAIDGLWEIQGENAEVVNLEMQSDLSSSLNMLNMLRASMFTQMRVVDLSTAQDKLGQITNFGVRMMYKDQVDDNEHKRTMYGKHLAELTRRAEMLMGFTEAKLPDIKWPDPLPINRLELVTALKTEKELGGLSVQTIQEELNRNPVVEGERKAEETNNESDGLADVLTKITNRGQMNMTTPRRMPMDDNNLEMMGRPNGG